MITDLTKISRFLSLVLRHNPSAAGIELDAHGWASVEELINGVNDTGRYSIDKAILQKIVETDDKQRYSYNEDQTLVRANQGHSVSVDVELEKNTPPSVLYHGTAERFLESIMHNGLQPRSRLYVHLSSDEQTAHMVGSRHGTPAILAVDTQKMAEDGFEFFLSKNGVWLTKCVPMQYLSRVK